MVAAVQCVGVPVDVQLLQHQVEVDIGDVPAFGILGQAVVPGIRPAVRGRGAEQDQLDPLLLTQRDDLIEIDLLRSRNVVHRIGGLGVVAPGVGLNDGDIVVAAVDVPFCGGAVPRQQLLPPVVVAVGGQDAAGQGLSKFLRLPHHAVTAVEHICLHQNDLRVPGGEDVIQIVVILLQTLADGAAVIAAEAVVTPELHRRNRRPALAVAPDEVVEVALHGGRHAAGQILWPEHRCERRQDRHEQSGKEDGTGNVFCCLFHCVPLLRTRHR